MSFISGMTHKWKHLDVKIPSVSELYLDSRIRLLVTKLNLQVAIFHWQKFTDKNLRDLPQIFMKI